MNMITVLLGSTGLLLLVAIVLSFNAMNSDSKDDEVRKLKQEIAALQAAKASPSLAGLPSASYAYPSLPAPTAAPAPTDPAAQGTKLDLHRSPDPAAHPIANSTLTPADPADPAGPDPEVPEIGDDEQSIDLAAQIEESDRRFREEQLRAENDLLKQHNQTLKNDLGVAWQPEIAAATKNLARTNSIKNAMLIARVTQFDREHGFAVIEVLQPESAQPGTVLAIRRRTGIYGQVTVDQIYPESQAIVNPIPNTFLGEEGVEVQPGDELIIPPF